MMKANIITMGCSKNVVDSENVAGHLLSAGIDVVFDRQKNDCPIVVINTCGFIGDAKEESVDIILQQAQVKQRGRKRRLLVVVGCLIERYKKELADEIPEVDAWFGVHQWSEVVRFIIGWAADNAEKDSILCPEQVDFFAQRLPSTPAHYAYLKIAEGCNRQCSYCAIPVIRGKQVSRDIDSLVQEAKDLVSAGVQEIILVAQDTTAYGIDNYKKPMLGTLLNRLATETGVSWIRLHYTFPTAFPLDAIEAMARHDNICNYIDIPLQHVSTSILKSMRRGITREQTIQLIDDFRRLIPDVCIRTTLMVGYPGETDAEFNELLDFVRTARFDRMGCFTYSPEEGTPAFALGDPVPEEVKEGRKEQLMTLQEQISLEKNEARVGKQCQVLIDGIVNGQYVSRSQMDSPEVDDEILFPVTDATHPERRIGTFAQVRITQAFENDLLAEEIR